MAVLCSRCRAFEANDGPKTCVLLEGSPCSACKEMTSIRHQIGQLEEELAKLKAKHNAVLTTMNVIHDPFIHKFPPEISSHIFRLCLPPLDFREPYITPRDCLIGLAAPLKLGGVCRRWRQVAWSTPGLWENVYIYIRPTMMLSLAESLPCLLREWLGRSRSLPLTISFHHGGLPCDSDSEEASSEDNSSDGSTPDDPMITLNNATESVIDILDSNSDRWQSLHVSAPAYIFLRFPAYNQHQLVNLRLQVIGGPHRPRFMTESEFAPTQLMLLYFPLTSVNVRLDHVTHLTLSWQTTEECLNVLRRALNLEYYKTSILEQSAVISGNPILHSRLHSLTLLGRISAFLDAIILPSLEELIHGMGHEDPYVTTRAMQSLLRRSNCSLKFLTITSLLGDYEVLRALLQAIPSLEHLELSFNVFGICAAVDHLLTHIFHPAPSNRSDISFEEGPTPESFLPRLQCLHFSRDPFPWDRIPQLYRHGHRKSLALKFTTHGSPFTRETALQLLQLTDEGVDLKIVDKTTGVELLENLRKRMFSLSVTSTFH
ncbi:hypothetical protein M413DRAFT_277990 [Hebeloma cylindrosporum]|uniref:F-box domain-containing protein n=1 Tax=Hebeloma cylindrosporum TaxID=76867 RepID=A0A0C3C0Z8_HEBCY|nr:hypothetical protein M413DRAFT_277990 [Hebeloma cylindrosporum h7]